MDSKYSKQNSRPQSRNHDGRPRGEKPRTGYDKPRTYGDKPSYDSKPRTYRASAPRAYGDKPAYGSKPRTGERPSYDKPRTYGDKPFNRGERPHRAGNRDTRPRTQTYHADGVLPQGYNENRRDRNPVGNTQVVEQPKKALSTHKAPAAIGPYSQGIEMGSFVFVSGQIPVEPKSEKLVTEIKSATAQVIDNIAAILASAELTLGNVVKTTVFMTNLDDFPAMNEVYEQMFIAPYPARSTIAVSNLPKGAPIEIECLALHPTKQTGLV